MRNLFAILMLLAALAFNVNRCVSKTEVRRSSTEINSAPCLIKGNISMSGERIYHVPGGEWYDKTRIDTSYGERWFCTEEEARAAGWRRAYE